MGWLALGGVEVHVEYDWKSLKPEQVGGILVFFIILGYGLDWASSCACI